MYFNKIGANINFYMGTILETDSSADDSNQQVLDENENLDYENEAIPGYPGSDVRVEDTPKEDTIYREDTEG